MADIYHVRGSDLIFSESGDISVASGVEAGSQRVLRRLSTNMGDYIFSLDYGAGLPARVGGVDAGADLEAIIANQLTLEPSVASDPAPTIAITTDSLGLRRISVTYISAETGDTVALEL